MVILGVVVVLVLVALHSKYMTCPSMSGHVLCLLICLVFCDLCSADLRLCSTREVLANIAVITLGMSELGAE